MSGPVVRLRVRSSRAPYRRGGIEFGNLPLVLGPEHIGQGIEGFRRLVAIATDPVLKVQRSTVEGESGDFVTLRPDEVDTLKDMLAGLEAGDSELAEKTADSYLRRIVGDQELQSPEGPDANGDDAAAPSPAANGKADGGTDAAPAVETPPASDASVAPDEQSRAGADASGAAPAADAGAGNQPEDTQQPPVADGTERPAPSAGDAASSAAAAPAAPADPQPEKGAPAPAEAKAKTAGKPRGSSGRQSGRAAAAKKPD
ncbi:hypothetical protein [Sphingopyxis granuli]|uniref:hypothetical protein n=1 Tax=Sphingopyxis granuli TaxID=267128 RepID=UPI001BAF425F|nr:hypothetical protein [Sphingopyxis granuli]QUM72187.1 hypothetical protein ICN83_18150 [Sphingopyxis granuli]